MNGLPDEDQPQDEGYSLVVPFVACVSHGGPYDDASFAAGFRAGEVDKALTVAAAAGADRAAFTVRTALLRQLELLAMNRGFPVLITETWVDDPEWTLATFSTALPADAGGAG